MVGAVEPPAVTVVIPTHRRPQQLAATLGGLASQQFDGTWDVVVVDNDPGGSAEPIVDRAEVGVPTRYTIEERPGAAHARNRGLEVARGAVVAFLDDDVVPQAGWLTAIVTPILDGRAEATGGRVQLDPTVPRPGWFDERTVGQYLTNWDLGRAAGELADDEIVVTANAAFERDLLRRAGGFDPALGPRGDRQYVSDDVQVLRAVRTAGGRGWWAPDAVVIHELPPERLRPTWILHRAYLQGRSDWRLDREALSRRRWNGTRVALGRLASELRARVAADLWRRPVAFQALCDLARACGALVEAASWSRSPGR